MDSGWVYGYSGLSWGIDQVAQVSWVEQRGWVVLKERENEREREREQLAGKEEE